MHNNKNITLLLHFHAKNAAINQFAAGALGEYKEKRPLRHFIIAANTNGAACINILGYATTLPVNERQHEYLKERYVQQ